jgi:hypothetical protein
MIVRRLLPTIATAFVLTTLACAEQGASGSGAAFEVDSSGRFPVVTSRGGAAGWQATLLFGIGAGEGGDTLEFGSIRSLLLDSAGTLMVADQRNRALKQFDSTGAFVRQIGREGAGPGEYRAPYSLAWLDGNLAVLDPGNPRLAMFSHAGDWITSWPVQPITGGQLIRLYRTPPTLSTFAFRRTATGSEQFYVEYDTSGPRDTVVQVSRPSDLDTGIRCDRPDKAISFFSNPYAASFLQIPLGGGRLAVARTDAYRIAILGRDHDTTRVISADATPSPVSDADWTAAQEEWEKFRRDWPTAQCSRTSFTRPPVKPVLNWLFLDDTGRLWAEVQTNQGLRYDVFNAEGRLQATVAGLPPSGGLDPSIASDRAAFVVVDSATDVQSVRVFRLHAARIR